MKTILVLGLLIVLTGCTSPQLRTAYHTISLGEAYQTQDFRNNSCVEANYVPRKLIGENPEPAPTIAFFLLRSYIYEYFSEKVDSVWFDWFAVGTATLSVAHNHKTCAGG